MAKSNMHRHIFGPCGALAVLLFAAATCGGGTTFWEGQDVDTFCRSNPRDCDFEIGGFCQVDDDCNDGVCCRDDDCDGGMCTYLCDRNGDCPPEMLCDSGHCFFTCNRDGDCGAGQECKEDDTVCQYD